MSQSGTTHVRRRGEIRLIWLKKLLVERAFCSLYFLLLFLLFSLLYLYFLFNQAEVPFIQLPT